MLQDLIISRVRVKILSVFLLSPTEMFYVRQVVRKTEEEINAVRRELSHLEKVGFLEKESRGNRLYYKIRKNYPLYFELLGLINKTKGLGKIIYKKRRKLGKIKFAMLSGQFARAKLPKKSKVDLLIVGNIFANEIAKTIKNAESKLKREINYTVMDENEFDYRKKRNDPFIKDILSGSRIMVIGDEEELLE